MKYNLLKMTSPPKTESAAWYYQLTEASSPGFLLSEWEDSKITVEDYKLIMTELDQRIERRRTKMAREQSFSVVATLIAGFTFNILAQIDLPEKNNGLEFLSTKPEQHYKNIPVDTICDWMFGLILSLVGTINIVYVVFATIICYKGAKVFTFRLEKKKESKYIYLAKNCEEFKKALFDQKRMVRRISRTLRRIQDFDEFWSDHKHMKKNLRCLFTFSCAAFLLAMMMRPAIWDISVALGFFNSLIYLSGVVVIILILYNFYNETRFSG